MQREKENSHHSSGDTGAFRRRQRLWRRARDSDTRAGVPHPTGRRRHQCRRNGRGERRKGEREKAEQRVAVLLRHGGLGGPVPDAGHRPGLYRVAGTQLAAGLHQRDDRCKLQCVNH